jgi:hypothetical protein
MVADVSEDRCVFSFEQSKKLEGGILDFKHVRHYVETYVTAYQSTRRNVSKGFV